MSSIQIIQGDCLAEMQKIPSKSIDAILCDLPYGVTDCKWDIVIPFKPLWEQYRRIIKENRAIVLTATQPFTSALVMSNTEMFKYCWTWNKRKGGNPFLSKTEPIRITEDVVVFGKGRLVYNPIMTPRDKPVKRGGNKGNLSETTSNAFTEDKTYTEYYPKNIIEISNACQRGRFHPTQKPVSLLEYLIKTYTNEWDTVLDNCAGSGTTGIACKNTNRNFIGIELDPRYCEIAEKRIGENQ